MAHEPPVAALVVAFTGNLGAAAHSINRLRPDALCFVLPEALKPAVETDLQPKITPMPRRWDWVLLSDQDSFPSCYRTLACALPSLLKTWGVEPGSLVVDLGGASPAMAGALTLVTMPTASRIVSLVEVIDGRDGETESVEGRDQLWTSINPWDEAADVMRRDGCELFNRGSHIAASAAFRQIEARVSGGQKPLYRAFADLADGYDRWERFQYRQAWDKLKQAAKAMEMVSLFGGSPGMKGLVPAIKANAGFLEKLVLDPAEVKESLAFDLLAHAGRRLHVVQDAEAAMRSLIRALEAFAQQQLFKQHRIKTWDVQPEQLPQVLQDTCRTCFLDDLDGKYKLPIQAQYRALASLGDPLGQAFLKEWPAMKPLLDAANHAVLGYGFEPVKAERVQQLYDVVVKLTGVTEASLPKFPVLVA